MDMNNLRDAIKSTAGNPPAPRTSPLCNPCAADEHERCPTVLAEYGSVIDSDYNCPCYRKDEDGHQNRFDAAQMAWEENRDSHFGRSDWGSEGRQRWDSVDGKFYW